ncbi:MAG: hypothetical protein M5U28_15805 [Sandaracinaceae bacterium]|nr:hypothetical protein [Sandaracinaceae bacterium]
MRAGSVTRSASATFVVTATHTSCSAASSAKGASARQIVSVTTRPTRRPGGSVASVRFT